MTEPGKLFIAGMRVVPKKSLSRAVRRLAQVRSKMAIRRFAARYGVAVEEAEKPIDEYEHLLDFFTRRLKPGLRPIDPDPGALVSPADAVYLIGGAIDDGQLVQAKGRTYALGALLADEGAALRFGGGSYFTAYLSPKDYHRVHSPVDGVITSSRHVPGALFPVNPAAVAHVDQLFARNERLVSFIETERFGLVALVMVGATNVGHISMVYDPELATNTGASDIREKRYDPPIPIARGAEIGVFEMGSTVIVVTERRVSLEIDPGSDIKVGLKLGACA